MSSVLYVLYDSRAVDEESTFDATIFETDEDINELIESAPDYGGGCIWKYQVDGKELVNGEFVKTTGV